MIVVRPATGAKAHIDRLERLKRALQPPAVTQVLERVALDTLVHVIEATPKKWTGQVRRSWRVERPSATLRVVSNGNKIMRWLEFGTANGGSGFIYPKKARALFVPLDRKAMYGYKPGLKFGVHFVLAARVRGIRPRKIVEAEHGLTRIRLEVAMKEHVRKALR